MISAGNLFLLVTLRYVSVYLSHLDSHFKHRHTTSYFIPSQLIMDTNTCKFNLALVCVYGSKDGPDHIVHTFDTLFFPVAAFQPPATHTHNNNNKLIRSQHVEYGRPPSHPHVGVASLSLLCQRVYLAM